MTTLSFLLFESSPFVIFDSDYALISCQLCKSNTLWNIFIILGKNVDQDETTCCVQKWQLLLSYFWCYLPLFCFWNWFRVHSVTQIPFRIFWWYLVEMKNRRRRHVANKNDNSAFLSFCVISLCYIWQWFALISCPLCKSNTLF